MRKSDAKKKTLYNVKFQKPQLWMGILGVLLVLISLTGCSASRKSESERVTESVQTEEITESVETGEGTESVETEEGTESVETKTESAETDISEICEVGVRAMSVEERKITDYIINNDLLERGYMNSYDGGEPLLFSEDCVFQVNYGMSKPRYETVDFSEFAQLIEESNFYISKTCMLTFENGLITEALLESAYYQYGIYTNDSMGYWWYTIEELQEQLENDYEKISTEYADVAACEGKEIIETYIGNRGDGNSGWVLVKDVDGTILHTEFVHEARAGWNNIYLGENEEGSFLLTLHIEDRDTYGEYSYHVFRFTSDGTIEQIAGSLFGFGDLFLYNDDLFREWIEELTPYLKNSYLLLTTQDGKIRSEHVSEAEQYDYEHLNLNSRPYIIK